MAPQPDSDAIRFDVSDGSRLCENALGRRMRRIVFSIAFFRKKLSVQSTPTSTKSRWKFYTQVGHRSFHTAWVKLRRTQSEQMSSGLPLKADIARFSGHVSNVPTRDSCA